MYINPKNDIAYFLKARFPIETDRTVIAEFQEYATEHIEFCKFAEIEQIKDHYILHFDNDGIGGTTNGFYYTSIFSAMKTMGDKYPNAYFSLDISDETDKVNYAIAVYGSHTMTDSSITIDAAVPDISEPVRKVSFSCTKMNDTTLSKLRKILDGQL